MINVPQEVIERAIQGQAPQEQADVPALTQEQEADMLRNLFGEYAGQPATDTIPEEVAVEAAPEEPVVQQAQEPGTAPQPEAPQLGRYEEAILALAQQMQRNNEINTRQGERFMQMMQPPAEEPELTEEQMLMKQMLDERVAPIEQKSTLLEQKNAQLEKQLQYYQQIEQQRVAEALEAELKQEYPGYSRQVLQDAFVGLVANTADGLMAQGMKQEEALKTAQTAVKAQWDNPAGIRNLWKLYGLQSSTAVPTSPAQAAETPRKPDPHISGQTSSAPSGNWQERMKSGDSKVRDSVLEDMFGE